MHTATRTVLGLTALLLSGLTPATAQVTPTETIAFPTIADTYVESTLPTSNFDTDARVRADAVPIRISYLRFAVSGLGGRPVQSAKVRLGVSGPSTKGGSMHLISNGIWNPSVITYDTRPAVDGPALATLGTVALGSTVDFNVTAAVTGEGTYNFALDSTSDDGVSYNSSAAPSGVRPQLVITVPAAASPVVRIAQPLDGAVLFVGDTATLEGTVTDDMDADLVAALAWTSNLQGALGTGALVPAALAEGNHTITAAVTDSSGNPGMAQIAVSVRPRPAMNMPPVVTIGAPAAATAVANGQAITFTGSAADAEDGAVTGSLQWTSSLDGTIGTGATFTRVLRAGTHRIAARVTDSGGQTGSDSITVTVMPPESMTFTAVADTYVSASKPTRKYGTVTRITAGATPDRQAFIRFAVSGVSPFSVTRAILRLTVGSNATDGSGMGGTVHQITNTTWSEGSTYYRNRPAIDGPALATAGSVAIKQVVDFDVTGAVAGDGSVSFALVTPLADSVVYRSRESTSGKPQLILSLGAPHIVLNGTFAASYQNETLYPNSRIDARGATFLSALANRYPINLGGGPGVLWTGGLVLGQWSRTLTWTEMHDLNNAAIVFENATLTVDGLRIDNVTDGVRPQDASTFTVRNVRMSYVRDDCVENDHVMGGLVDDSLLDGCYNAFSARPSQAIIDSGFSGATYTWTIQNTLVRLQPMPGPNSATADGLGHGGFFKWHKWDDPANSISPKLALHNNIFLAERVGDVGGDRMGVPPGQVVSCSNNVVVWLGGGAFPGTLPGPCFTVTTNRGVWDNALASWTVRHPGVAP